MALELVKYQTVVALLFSQYFAPSVIEYDRLFRQAAARDRAMRWDSTKEDTYVWALTQSNSISVSLPTTPTARVTTLVKDAQNAFELQRAHTPLRHSQFERELAHHPDN